MPDCICCVYFIWVCADQLCLIKLADGAPGFQIELFFGQYDGFFRIILLMGISKVSSVWLLHTFPYKFWKPPLSLRSSGGIFLIIPRVITKRKQWSLLHYYTPHLSSSNLAFTWTFTIFSLWFHGMLKVYYYYLINCMYLYIYVFSLWLHFLIFLYIYIVYILFILNAFIYWLIYWFTFWWIF